MWGRPRVGLRLPSCRKVSSPQLADTIPTPKLYIPLLGGNQTIQRVIQWPGQEAQHQQAKIPTLVWYDMDKKVLHTMFCIRKHLMSSSLCRLFRLARRRCPIKRKKMLKTITGRSPSTLNYTYILAV